TGLVCLGEDNQPVVAAWREILSADNYRQSQSLPWYERPPHHFGDQEVLTGLMGAEEFSGTPVTYLKEGREIIQMFGPAGFGLKDRLYMANKGLPPLVHSMGHKPWRKDSGHHYSGLREWYNRLHGELSPYMDVARDAAGDHLTDYPWLTAHTRISKAFRGIMGQNASMAGFPLAALDLGVRKAKRLLGKDAMNTS
ncbi:MAG: hypothetical protein AAF723_03765, partial [Pseudomonadota bacterium]